ncbi:MAG: hemolysin [Bacteroidetes bacterium]|nr:MAG: hemolysin [Bacteroidota bacterium]
MQDIIAPVAPELIEKELTPELFLRRANNGGTDIYHFTAAQAPNTMRELGRLREEAFRDAGGGTGLEMDIDAFDTSDHPYHQLIVWDPVERLILGGYRYIIPSREGFSLEDMATYELFDFSQEFIDDYLPKTIELGRSFVTVAYQGTKLRRKGMYALDNLWDGLGAILKLNPGIEYFFGKVTMYTNYNPEARNALMYFLNKRFPDKDRLVFPREPLEMNMNLVKLAKLFCGKTFREDFERIVSETHRLGERVPPLIKSYMNLSATLRVFGTSINPEFGGVEETGILVTVDDIHEDKKERHIDTFNPDHGMRMGIS